MEKMWSPLDAFLRKILLPIRLVFFIMHSIFYHINVVIKLTYKLASALAKGTTTWIIMVCRLLGFVFLLMSGWARMALYYAFNKHVIRNIKFGNAPRNYLDVYLPMKANSSRKCAAERVVPRDSSTEGVPVIILVSGGAWIIGYKMWNALLARGLSYYGYLVVLPDYRNYPQGNIQDMIHDTYRCVGWVMEHAHEYGGDGSSIILGGQSAGAHISLSLLVELYKDCHGSPSHTLHAPQRSSDRTDTPNGAPTVISASTGGKKVAFSASTTPTPPMTPSTEVREQQISSSKRMLTRIKLYVGISGPYNLAEVVYHLHNRGLDYSILSWIFKHNTSKYSPSIQLAQLAGIPLHVSTIEINKAGAGDGGWVECAPTQTQAQTQAQAQAKDPHAGKRQQKQPNRTRISESTVSVANHNVITRMSLSTACDDDYMLSDFNYFDLVGYTQHKKSSSVDSLADADEGANGSITSFLWRRFCAYFVRFEWFISVLARCWNFVVRTAAVVWAAMEGGGGVPEAGGVEDQLGGRSRNRSRTSSRWSSETVDAAECDGSTRQAVWDSAVCKAAQQSASASAERPRSHTQGGVVSSTSFTSMALGGAGAGSGDANTIDVSYDISQGVHGEEDEDVAEGNGAVAGADTEVRVGDAIDGTGSGEGGAIPMKRSSHSTESFSYSPRALPQPLTTSTSADSNWQQITSMGAEGEGHGLGLSHRGTGGRGSGSGGSAPLDSISFANIETRARSFSSWVVHSRHRSAHADISAVLHDFPPVALFHGKMDKCIPFYSAIELSQILKLGGLPPSRIHVSIYNHWGHTDGMLEDLLCGDMTLILDIYRLVAKYAAIPLDAAQREAVREWEDEAREGEEEGLAHGGNRARLDSKEVEQNMERVRLRLGRHQLRACTPRTRARTSSGSSSGGDLGRGKARYDDVGVMGEPHVPMVPRTLATIAKFLNPF